MIATSARFISIEGIEGAGKSTAVAFIRDYLQKQSIPAYFTREPGGTPIAESIRQLLLHHEAKEVMQAETELLLMFAARAQHIAHCIKPHLQNNEWVISDRFIDASYAYQAAGRALSKAFIRTLDEHIVKQYYPHLTILLDISPELGLKRAATRGNKKDRIESEQIEFFERVRNAYLERYRSDPERIKLIDASLSLDSVQQQVETVLTTFISSMS